jgi:hypothetical protein
MKTGSTPRTLEQKQAKIQQKYAENAPSFDYKQIFHVKK